MSKPTLYIFMGPPGAGKTTIATAIANYANARNICADAERHRLFPNPTHSHKESTGLYAKLNAATDYLLEKGTSVVFDTNFNFYKDREYMREIAARHDANLVLIWLTTPTELAKKRAVHIEETRNGYDYAMTAQQFDAIVAKFEKPKSHEKFITINGTEFDEASLSQLLQ